MKTQGSVKVLRALAISLFSSILKPSFKFKANERHNELDGVCFYVGMSNCDIAFLAQYFMLHKL